MNGKNDPYVKLELGRQRAVTRVQLKTNDPDWNEHFVFGVTSVESEQLRLVVRDYDRFKVSDMYNSRFDSVFWRYYFCLDVVLLMGN